MSLCWFQQSNTRDSGTELHWSQLVQYTAQQLANAVHDLTMSNWLSQSVASLPVSFSSLSRNILAVISTFFDLDFYPKSTLRLARPTPARLSPTDRLQALHERLGTAWRLTLDELMWIIWQIWKLSL